MQARLADLRAAWATAAEDVGSGELGVIRDRHARIAAGQAAVLVQVVGSVLLWLVLAASVAEAAPRHASADETRCGLGVMAGIIVMMTLGGLLLPVVVAIARAVGHRWGERRGDRACKQVMADPMLSEGDTGRALERLTNQTPAAAVLAHARRLELPSVRWGVAGSGQGLYLICLAVLAMSWGHGLAWRVFLPTILALGIQLAAVAYAGAWTRSPGVLASAVPAAVGLVILLTVVQPSFIIVAVLQLMITLRRVYNVRDAVVAERTALVPR